jgi:phage terminase small subunit
MATTLTPNQCRFVEEYLKDLNATQAAIRAGYSKRGASVTGSKLLVNPKVADAVQAAKVRRSRRVEVTADSVIRELARIAFSDMREFAEWGPTGVKLRDSAALDEHDARSVAEVSEAPGKFGSTLKFKLHSKTAALDLLAKHTGVVGGDLGADPADVARRVRDALRAIDAASGTPTEPAASGA